MNHDTGLFCGAMARPLSPGEQHALDRMFLDVPAYVEGPGDDNNNDPGDEHEG